jgi:Ti-type conjugative transfer relaxase TraA
MAIYHFSVKVISRAAGSSALAAAAYRSASRLHDQRLDRHHDFSNKAGVVHSEVMLPEHAPDEWQDREQLWNAVEAVEIRKDAQLAREVEFAIPREMSQAEGIALARDFVQREFVDQGMVADLNVHWDIGADGEPKPHAHVMLGLREVTQEGFGAKVRDWNSTQLLTHWREAWADHVNERLAELDIDARVDHRSLEEQGIALEPQHKIGPAASRMVDQGQASERLEEHLDIARSNGEKILANPNIALDGITHGQATFTTRDLAMFVHRHSEGKDHFDAIMAAVKASPDLVALGKDGRGEERFTSRSMLETEQRLEKATVTLDARRHHGVADRHVERAMQRASERGLDLSSEQRGALEHVTCAKDLSNVIGYAGTGKSAMLGVARDAWELAGYEVRGAALSGIAAENLESGSGIASRTIAGMEHQWAQDRELLTDRSILVIDEAGMIGTRQMERVLKEAEKRRAKVVLVGDPEQLQAIEAGASFRSIAERHGGVEITSIRRQQEDWQRDATRALAIGRTDEAITAYEEKGHVHAAETRDDARRDLIDRWDQDRIADPQASRIILTHTNDAVYDLNQAARAQLRAADILGDEVRLTVARGARSFAQGDRVMFLRNERSLGVKNGSLGTIAQVSQLGMRVMLDDGRSVGFDVKDYADIDHGYAATIHKAQGMTVDKVHVLATPGLDRHASYVALSRHRRSVDLHYGRDDFADRGKLLRTLGRERGKDMASDYDQARAPVRQPESSPFAGLKLNAAPTVEKVAAQPPEVGTSPDVAAEIPGAIQRHARAVQAIFVMQDQGSAMTPDQAAELGAARKGLNDIREHAARDAEAAYIRRPLLIGRAAQGDTETARRAILHERDVRTDPNLRADRFVADWNRKSQAAEQAYVDGDEPRRRVIQNSMRSMALSLERDPQLESILANRKSQLGISVEGRRSLGADLAFNHGIDMGRGRARGIGIGM